MDPERGNEAHELPFRGDTVIKVGSTALENVMQQPETAPIAA
jgi:hypothetical protein